MSEMYRNMLFLLYKIFMSVKIKSKPFIFFFNNKEVLLRYVILLYRALLFAYIYKIYLSTNIEEIQMYT